MIHYNQTKSEQVAAENEVCRQIIREISNFGVSQRQVLMIMYLLAMELEDVSRMQALTRLIRELGGDEMFLIGKPAANDEIGGLDGSSNA